MKDFRFITISNERTKKTYVVLADKVNDFCEDMRAEGVKGSIHINYATQCLNGVIGRGNYIKTIEL